MTCCPSGADAPDSDEPEALFNATHRPRAASGGPYVILPKSARQTLPVECKSFRVFTLRRRRGAPRCTARDVSATHLPPPCPALRLPHGTRYLSGSGKNQATLQADPAGESAATSVSPHVDYCASRLPERGARGTGLNANRSTSSANARSSRPSAT